MKQPQNPITELCDKLWHRAMDVTKLLLSESDIKTAIQQYVRSQGYICHSVAMEVDQNEDYYGNKTGYVVRAAAVAELSDSWIPLIPMRSR